jgi:protoporphyrinogen/coproporphyrinogen III oxidase
VKGNMGSVIIIGGGIAGLSAAYYLQKARPDISITLLEASERLGGKIQTVHDQGFLIEGGPDAVVRYKPWALEMWHDLGLSEQVIGTIPAKPSALIHNGKQALAIPSGLQVVIPGDLKAMITTPLLSPLGKLRASLDWVIPKDPSEDEAFGHFIQRRLGKEIWERLVAPLSGGIYGGDPYELSTMAAFPQLKALEQRHGSLLRGALEQRKARGSRETGQIFASLKRGLGTWIDALQKNLSTVSIYANTSVQGLSQKDDEWQVYTSQGWLSASALIITTPAPITAKLLQLLSPEAAKALSEIPYGDSATVSLAFPKNTMPQRIGHGMLMTANSGFQVRGFSWTDQKWLGRAPENYGLARAYFSGVTGTKEDLLDLALKDLQNLWGKLPELSHSWIFQWKEGLPQYKVGHLGRIQQALKAEALPGLFLVGAAYQGVGLPDVVKMSKEQAHKAADFMSQKEKVI